MIRWINKLKHTPMRLPAKALATAGKLWVLIILVLISFGLLFLINKKIKLSRSNATRCVTKNITNKVEQNESNVIKPDMIVQNFSIKEVLKNKKESLLLNSKQGRIFRKSNKIECNNVSCWLSKEERLAAKFKSETSLLDREKKEVFFSGDVSGKIDAFKIHGKNINYDFDNQKATTDECLNYAYPNFKFSAQKSVLNLKDDVIEMDGGIVCEIRR